MNDQVEVARAALAELTPPGTVGELLERTAEQDGVATLSFAAILSGYPGWHWSVSVAELPGEAPTVLEAELMPGDGALLAPDWVPWDKRLEEYRAAQAAAELGEAEDEGGDDSDDDSGDDFVDVDDYLDDDELDDDVELTVPARGDDEQDEAEPESADDAPEHPDQP